MVVLNLEQGHGFCVVWDSDLSGDAGLEFCVVVEAKWRLGGPFFVGGGVVEVDGCRQT
jgi:hypothetical protein